MKVAVIGGGIFGAMTALRLAEHGQQVTLFERLPDIMLGASHNNQNRLHLGFHYPRDDETARQCALGFEKFSREFKDCLLTDFPNAYFISDHDSLTSPDEFLSFCARNHLPYDPIDLGNFTPTVRNVALGINTKESVFDATLVREKLKTRLRGAGVRVRTSREVTHIYRCNNGFLLTSDGLGSHYDAVVNCCYADIDRLTAELGHEIKPRRFQYTTIAIVELDWPKPAGIIILDGQFTSVLPYGRTGLHLLSHVTHTPIAVEVRSVMDPAWRDGAPFKELDKNEWLSRIIKVSSEFIPDLQHARCAGFLHGPRMFLSDTWTDARPSIIEQPDPSSKYITVFAGKVDHAMWVPDAVLEKLK